MKARAANLHGWNYSSQAFKKTKKHDFKMKCGLKQIMPLRTISKLKFITFDVFHPI